MIAADLLAAIVRGDVTEWPGAHDAALESAFLSAAIDHSVEALVVWQLRRAGAFDRWPQQIASELGRIAREEALIEAGRQGELRRVIAAVAAAGLPCLLMKGAALAYSRYPEPWLRSRNDNDLLVRGDDAAAASRVLQELGYEPTNALEGELVNHQVPYLKTDRIGLRHVVDLHWKISNRLLFADVLSFDELQGDAIAVPALGDGARAPSDVHELLLACLHPVAHHRNTDNLLWTYDIHLLASRLAPGQFDEFAMLARTKGLSAICASGLRRASERFHTPVPASMLDGLSVAGEASESYLGSRPWRGDVRLADFGALPGWRAKLRLLREVTVPSTEYMLKAYHARSRVLIPALHVHRLARGTWRLIRRFAQ